MHGRVGLLSINARRAVPDFSAATPGAAYVPYSLIMWLMYMRQAEVASCSLMDRPLPGLSAGRERWLDETQLHGILKPRVVLQFDRMADGFIRLCILQYIGYTITSTWLSQLPCS